MSNVTTDVARAVAVLRAGGVVAIPTETVYGLAADADNIDAVSRVFAVKGRPRSHPLIVHVASVEEAGRWGRFDERARRLVDVLWPGPLTVIVPRTAQVSDVITGGLDTVAIRLPSHPTTLSLLEEFDGAVVAPSANRFGMVSPTCAEHVERDLGNDVDLILDGGPCDIGVESTIVDCTTDPVQILRHGAVSPEDVERVLQEETASSSGPSRAPGMLTSHYAPRCAVELFENPGDAEARRRALDSAHVTSRVIDRSDDVVDYARHLYADLRQCDSDAIEVALFVLPPSAGLGRAVRDRLAKASAPRPR